MVAFQAPLLRSAVRVHSVPFVFALLVMSTQALQGPQPGLLKGLKDAKAAEAEVAPVLFRALYSVFGGGSGKEASSRVAALATSLRPAFESQPHVSLGRLTLEAARGVAYSYFEREHGWLIKGLEPPFVRDSSTHVLHEVSVLRKSPEMVQALIDVEHEHRGLSLGDLAATVTAVERLLLDESTALVQAAYELNGVEEMDWISKDDLHQILQSYLLIFRQGSKANLMNAEKHKQLKARAEGSGRSWTELKAFESKVVDAFDALAIQLNGDTGDNGQYSFEDVAQITRDVTLRYGKWQDQECKAMSSDLLGLDASHDGRVPLGIFHEQQRNPVYGYQFTESANYLRAFGQLEEQAGEEPHVLIANYIAGPSNCIGTSQFLSVCCLNTCESLAEQVYAQARSPLVEPGKLGAIVSNLSTPLLEASRTKLLQELEDIATKQQGMVQLAKPEFRQWLHRAFPGRCQSLSPDAFLPQASGGSTGPVLPSVPVVPPTHRPNHEDCTRMPSWLISQEGTVFEV